MSSIAAGDCVATLAVRDETTWDGGGIVTRAASRGGTLIVSGTKRFVTDADVAVLLVTAARRDDGTLVLLVVDRNADGVVGTPVETLDGSRPLATVELRDVRIDAEHVLPGDGQSTVA